MKNAIRQTIKDVHEQQLKLAKGTVCIFKKSTWATKNPTTALQSLTAEAEHDEIINIGIKSNNNS